MADLVNVPKSSTVSIAEVESFKIERAAEKEFVKNLAELVGIFGTKVSAGNRMYMSMVRFLRSNV